MQFLSSIFGPSGNTAVGAIFALGLVMVLIVLSVWALKFVFKTSGTIARGRKNRLAVIDTLQIDGRRQLLIVRRDNTEHLILTGGAQDLVIESGIAVEPAAAIAATEPAAERPPMVAPPAPVAPPRPAPEVTPVAAQTPVSIPDFVAVPGGAAERLRERVRPLGKRSPSSLRHTGLMRSSAEVIPAHFDGVPYDSARTTPLAETKGGSGSLERDGVGL